MIYLICSSVSTSQPPMPQATQNARIVGSRKLFMTSIPVLSPTAVRLRWVSSYLHGINFIPNGVRTHHSLYKELISPHSAVRFGTVSLHFIHYLPNTIIGRFFLGDWLVRRRF